MKKPKKRKRLTKDQLEIVRLKDEIQRRDIKIRALLDTKASVAGIAKRAQEVLTSLCKDYQFQVGQVAIIRQQLAKRQQEDAMNANAPDAADRLIAAAHGIAAILSGACVAKADAALHSMFDEPVSTDAGPQLSHG